MTPEAQRIAIAEACGIKKRCDTPEQSWANGVWTWPDGHETYGNALPGYLSDLNAMHEAEKVLITEVQQKEFARQLHFNEGGKHFLLRDFEALHATAAQRAEAFLRTLNLWE